MRQHDPMFGAIHNGAAVAEVLGLATEDLDTVLPVQTVSTGMAVCVVPLRSMEALERLRVPYGKAGPYLEHTGAKFFYCVTRAPEGTRADWRARMQFYGGEDAATGSAAGCMIAYLVRHGSAESGVEVVIKQGLEMGRPSRLVASALRVGDRITDVFVGGRTVPVASGRLFMP